MKRNILFVTDTHGKTDEGLSYALELARMIDKGISILMVQPKKLSKRFEDVMTAITFAEAGEHDTAREYYGAAGFDEASPQDEVEKACRRSGVSPNIQTSSREASTAIKDYLKENNSVDIVVLSPNITMNGGFSSRTLNRLVKTVSAPIVTLTRNTQAV